MLVYVARFCSSFPSDLIVIECLPYLTCLYSYLRNLALPEDPVFQYNIHWCYGTDSSSVAILET